MIAIDNAGNISAELSVDYIIDKTIPSVQTNSFSGSYNEIQQIRLICIDPEGFDCQNIYFTTDGSTPTIDSRGLYSGDRGRSVISTASDWCGLSGKCQSGDKSRFYF